MLICARLDDPLATGLDFWFEKTLDKVREWDTKNVADLFRNGCILELGLVRTVGRNRDVTEMQDGGNDAEEVLLLLLGESHNVH